MTRDNNHNPEAVVREIRRKTRNVCRQNIFNRTGIIIIDGFDSFKLKPVLSCFVVFSALASAF